ncbi:hypothetical protein RhiTH_010709 [Rhizoctonia solani]
MSFAKSGLVKAHGSSFINSNSFAIASLNKLSGSSSNARTQEPHKINFTEEGNSWRKGETEEWYQQQTKLSTTFKLLEYRKERESPFFHEFIVVDLGNDTVCRFDRRGDVNNRSNVLVGEPIPSEDTAHVIAKSDITFYPEIKRTSDLTLRMHFPQGQDILTILAVCYGIQANKNTQAYSLTRYNCYFFSWMIITATARCTVDWARSAQEEILWNNLVASVINGLSQDPGPGPKEVVAGNLALRNKAETLVPFSFVGSAYLLDTLRKALGETREQIRKSLSELILHSTIDKTMRDLSENSAQKAANHAARVHATHAAQDAAMEAVVENMWRDILSSAQGGDLWKEKCRLAVACVQKASDAAAKEAGQPYRVITTPAINPARETEQPPPIAERQAWGLPTLPPAKWEIAWNDSSNFSKASISNRAKIAWIKAWEEACKANDRYIPLISQGVAKYVTMNLPSTTPEVLQFETDPTVIKGMVKALIPIKGSSTSSLQDWVKGRIIEHCQRVTKLTAGTQQPNKTEFEDTMYDIWACTVNCLSDVARTKTISG